MPTVESVIDELKAKGNEKTRVIYSRHGHPIERTLGVNIADLKPIAKALKGQQELTYGLYETGLLDAMYLAGMVADGAKMPRERLQSWAEGAAEMPMIYEYTVPWVAVESPFRWELAADWTGSREEHLGAAGWYTYSGLVTTLPDGALDLGLIEGLLGRVVSEIGQARNKVKLNMNSFVISVGTYVLPLSSQAKAVAARLGPVSVDMGDTACKVPLATAAIAKAEAAGKLGQKRKTIRC